MQIKTLITFWSLLILMNIHLASISSNFSSALMILSYGALAGFVLFKLNTEKEDK